MNAAEPVVQRQLEAYNAKDLAGWLATYHPQAEQYALHGALLARGHDEMAQRMRVRFAEPDLHAQLLSRSVMDTAAGTAVVVDHERITRNFEHGRGHVEMLCVYEVADGLIVKASFASGAPVLDAAAADDERAFLHTRVLEAPCERVFAALADPGQLARWWGPAGFSSRFHAFDFRPGGAWRLTLRGPDGNEYPNECRFGEIVPDRQVVIDHLGHPFRLTITLDEAGPGRTRIRWRQVFDSAAERERLAAVVQPANEQNLDRLAAVLRGTD